MARHGRTSAKGSRQTLERSWVVTIIMTRERVRSWNFPSGSINGKLDIFCLQPALNCWVKSSRNSLCESGIKEIYKAKTNESMAIQTENLAVLWRLGYNKRYVIQEATPRIFRH